MPTGRRLRLTCVALLAAAAVAWSSPVQSRGPKLIVLLVVDQMRADDVARFQHEWTGGFHRLLAEGARFTRADYPYSPPRASPRSL